LGAERRRAFRISAPARPAILVDARRFERLAVEPVFHPIGNEGADIEIVGHAMNLAAIDDERLGPGDLVIEAMGMFDREPVLGEDACVVIALLTSSVHLPFVAPAVMPEPDD